MLIMESLRARCVYDHVLAIDDTLVLKGFYTYMFDTLSLALKKKVLNKGVSDEVIKKMNIDGEKIDECVENSFEKKGDY